MMPLTGSGLLEAVPVVLVAVLVVFVPGAVAARLMGLRGLASLALGPGLSVSAIVVVGAPLPMVHVRWGPLTLLATVVALWLGERRRPEDAPGIGTGPGTDLSDRPWSPPRSPSWRWRSCTCSSTTSPRNGPGGLMRLDALPLWLIEGMAEYFSLGREDPLTAMWMRDAVMRDKLPTIKQLTTDPRFFPYRYGQALWAYVGGRWGDRAIVDVYRTSLRLGLRKGSVACSA